MKREPDDYCLKCKYFNKSNGECNKEISKEEIDEIFKDEEFMNSFNDKVVNKNIINYNCSFLSIKY